MPSRDSLQEIITMEMLSMLMVLQMPTLDISWLLKMLVQVPRFRISDQNNHSGSDLLTGKVEVLPNPTPMLRNMIILTLNTTLTERPLHTLRVI